MAYPILGTPSPAFFDSSGAPLASGTITTLDPADDSVKASYGSADDADASNDPTSGDITLDASGRPTSTQYWGRDGEDYKVVIKDSSGSTVLTMDDIRMAGPHRQPTVTFTSTDATPSVAEGKLFLTSGITPITDFDDGQVGDTIHIKASGNILITDGSPTGTKINLQGQQNFHMAVHDTLTLTMFVDQVWQEVARTYEETTVRFKTADESLTDTTLADDTHLAGWTLQPATYFRVTGYLKATSDGDTQDLKFALQSSQTFQEAHWSYTNVNDSGTLVGDADTATTAMTADIVTGTVHGIQIVGHLLAHTSSTSSVDLQVAQGTDAGTTTLERGSWLAIEEL